MDDLQDFATQDYVAPQFPSQGTNQMDAFYDIDAVDEYAQFADLGDEKVEGFGFNMGSAEASQQLSFEEADASEPVGMETEELPAWACAYCGIHNPQCMVQCVTTGKWFCNGKANRSGSCIVQHLVKTRNKEVRLHREGLLGDTLLECYCTGNRNVFSLGFVPARQENTVVLLARDVPANHAQVKDLDVDVSLWEPVIQERAFVSWLVKVPSKQELMRARHLTGAQMSRLEELWKSNAEATVEDMEDKELQDEVVHVALRYEDAFQYQNVMGPLLKLEMEHQKAVKCGQSQRDVRISRWEVSLNRSYIAYLRLARDDGDVSLEVGEELLLHHAVPGPGRGPWSALGQVVAFTNAEEVAVELNRNETKQEVPTETMAGFDVDVVFKAVPFDRMQLALKTFAVDDTSISAFLYHVLLGHDPDPRKLNIPLPAKLSAPNLPELNHSQLSAVKAAIQSPLTLIQGPPGTGKTVTSATLVWHMARLTPGQVLVAAPSNIAVDHLAERIALTGLKVVRVMSRMREALASTIEPLTLHYQVANIPADSGYNDVRKLLQLKREFGELNVEDSKRLARLQMQLERDILREADVICTTCIGCGSQQLRGFKFEQALLDESTQATEPETLLPLVKGAKQVVLVGDHCQLGPTVMSKKAAAAGLSMSLVERLVLLGVKPLRLQVQYRMHPCLSEYPSNTFYEGALQNGVSCTARTLAGLEFPWPVPETPMMMYIQTGKEELSSTGRSYLNRTEAATVEKIVTHMLHRGIRPDQIGVITPYEGQRTHISSLMQATGQLHGDLYKQVEVASVDAFQGREKDFILLTCVRSNEQRNIGFLSDPRRLNVALTRARYGMVVLGNALVLSKQPIWNSLLVHFQERGCLVEGPLTNLRPSMLSLQRSRVAFDRQSFSLGGPHSKRYRPTERVLKPEQRRALMQEQQQQGGGEAAPGKPAADSARPPASGATTTAPRQPGPAVVPDVGNGSAAGSVQEAAAAAAEPGSLEVVERLSQMSAGMNPFAIFGGGWDPFSGPTAGGGGLVPGGPSPLTQDFTQDRPLASQLLASGSQSVFGDASQPPLPGLDLQSQAAAKPTPLPPNESRRTPPGARPQLLLVLSRQLQP